jgi:hypothetical protein
MEMKRENPRKGRRKQNGSQGLFKAFRGRGTFIGRNVYDERLQRAETKRPSTI